MDAVRGSVAALLVVRADIGETSVRSVRMLLVLLLICDECKG